MTIAAYTHVPSFVPSSLPAVTESEPAPARATTGPATLLTADGYPIGITWLRASGTPKGVVIVAGAIGVPQRFYRRFARYTQHRGFDVVTFDYRGIARSAPAALRGFRMNFLDWGRLDLAAVIAHAANRADAVRVPLYLVAHSFGGHAFGMSHNHHRVHACFSYGTGAGWHGWMTLRERLKVLALWNIAGPLLTRWKGYLPWSLVRMGEDLPIDVYHQWRRWCRYPRFFLDDPEIGEEMRAQLNRVRTPICAVSAIDDAWSPPRSRDAMLSGYRRAPIERIDLDPTALQLGPLGHMGFFRANAGVLWAAAIDWLEAAGSGRSESTT